MECTVIIVVSKNPCTRRSSGSVHTVFSSLNVAFNSEIAFWNSTGKPKVGESGTLAAPLVSRAPWAWVYARTYPDIPLPMDTPTNKAAFPPANVPAVDFSLSFVPCESISGPPWNHADWSRPGNFENERQSRTDTWQGPSQYLNTAEHCFGSTESEYLSLNSKFLRLMYMVQTWFLLGSAEPRTISECDRNWSEFESVWCGWWGWIWTVEMTTSTKLQVLMNSNSGNGWQLRWEHGYKIYVNWRRTANSAFSRRRNIAANIPSKIIPFNSTLSGTLLLLLALLTVQTRRIKLYT